MAIRSIVSNKKAYALLWLVPIIWGMTFPIIHFVLQEISANLFVFWRFIIAGLVLFPVFIQVISRRRAKFRDVKYGFIIGVINSGAFIFQSLALEHGNSAEVAFLTGINVVLVPLLMPIFGLRMPKAIEIIAALVCLFGIYLVSNASMNSFSREDYFVLLSALFIAIGIIIVEKAAVKSTNLRVLTFYQIIFTSIVPFMVLKGHVLDASMLNYKVIIVLLYCAVFATSIALLMQMKYQPVIGSNKAAIIFSMEAVFATIFAYLFGESITSNVVIGGAVIVLSSLIVDIVKLPKSKYNKK